MEKSYFNETCTRFGHFAPKQFDALQTVTDHFLLREKWKNI